MTNLVQRRIGRRVETGQINFKICDIPQHSFVSRHIVYCYTCLEPCSSGSIVSDYGLDDRAIGVRSPAGAKDFSSSRCVQNGSGVHPASCTMGTGGPFPGGKARPGLDADHSPPSSAKVENE
jgi:hypothetical protein